jgi:hypothetical protein|tara:strand:+ start:455 stop:628 length:174 start_codon:yes stop_codon:yes gene_type:complete
MEVVTIQFLPPSLLLNLVDPAEAEVVHQVILVEMATILHPLLLRVTLVVEGIMAIHM